MASRLTDGQPLTLEWLNSIISELEDLRSVITAGDEARKPVKYTGSLASLSNIQIEAQGISIGTVPKTGKQGQIITFKTAFNKAPVVTVVARRRNSGVIPVLVKEVKATQFTVNFAVPIPA